MVKKLKNRKQIDPKYKWHLEDIYADNSAWEKDFSKVERLTAEIKKFKGKLDQGPNFLRNALDQTMELFSISEKLFVFASMRKDEDGGNSTYQGLFSRIQTLSTKVSAATSFIEPEIIALPKKNISEFLGQKESIKYKHFLENLQRQKKHYLSEAEEELLAKTEDLATASKDTFQMLHDVDLVFPKIKDEKGREVELTEGNYSFYIKCADRRVRRDAFEGLFGTYYNFRNTFASMLRNSTKKDFFYAYIRHYDSSLDRALFTDNIERPVYENLIKVVNKNLPVLRKYLKFRKKSLGLTNLQMYDLYADLTPEPKAKISYEEAVKMVTDGLDILGSEYAEALKKILMERRVDVLPNKGKRGGAYQSGSFLTPQYILLNYQGMIHDVFTLAHESGHAVHSHFSNLNQPYINSGFTIFTTEVASTVNETLLIKYMLSKSKNNKERAYLLNQFLESIRTTIVRQVMFSEFEAETHAKLESGIPLTTDLLMKIYFDLNSRYYGSEVKVDPLIGIEWARIPHFYRNFYVYKYATGLSAAISISKQILSEGKPAVDRYIEFLKSGNSDYSLNLLKKAGVDLTTEQPIQETFDEFEKSLAELEKILKE